MVRLCQTFSNLLFTGEARCAGCSYTSSGWFKRSSNLLEPHHDRDSRACRVLSYEFGVVRLYRTFSNYIFTGETRCAGCSCTSSGWFKRIESPRTFSNHLITEIAWSDCTEPSLTTSLQGLAGCLCTSSGWFKRIEPPRTFSNHIIAEIARCVEFFHMSSGWFDCAEPSLT